MTEEKPARKNKGGRPKGDPAAVRSMNITVRVSPAEHETLATKAAEMGIPPAQWLRDAALKRRLPSLPVPAINRKQYAELARLSANLNQLAHAANTGYTVTVAEKLLSDLQEEVRRLRYALINQEKSE